MLRPFVSLLGPRRGRHSPMEDRPSLRRPRRATPQFETLEKIIALSAVGGVTVSAAATQTEIASPTVHLSVSANASGQSAKAINYVIVNEHIRFGAQSQTALVGAGQQGPSQGSQSPGNTVVVSATATQTEIANPTVDLSVSANASGNHALAINIIVVNMNIQFGNQSQTVHVGAGQQGPSQGGQSQGNTVTVSATATQEEIANPTVDLSEFANASGNHAKAVNVITVTMNVQFGAQTALVGVSQQGPSQGGQSPGNTVSVNTTATQTKIASPTVDLSEFANASGNHAKADNHVNVNIDMTSGTAPNPRSSTLGPVNKVRAGVGYSGS